MPKYSHFEQTNKQKKNVKPIGKQKIGIKVHHIYRKKNHDNLSTTMFAAHTHTQTLHTFRVFFSVV